MNITSVIMQALGGLGLFLFGMKLMSEGLQKAAGDRLRSFLEAVSANRVVGCMVGAGVSRTPLPNECASAPYPPGETRRPPNPPLTQGRRSHC